jgi:hypothetical protein
MALDCSDQTYGDDEDIFESAITINFNHEKCSRFLQDMLKQAGVILRGSSAQGNESLIVNKLRRPLSNAIVSGSSDNVADEEATGYAIPSCSSFISSLQLVNCQIKDINILFHNMLFPKLVYLNLSFNLIKDISPPGIGLSFANISLLDISHNRISSLEFLSSLTTLKILRCHSNQIESLSPLQYLNNIEEVWVNNNKIEWTQFMFFSNSIQLKKLVKYGNPGDEKPKMNEFLLTIIPTLIFIDQEFVDRYKVSSSNKHVNSNETNSVDSGNDIQANKISTDVRVMITQAKATLKRDFCNGNEDGEELGEDKKMRATKWNQRNGSMSKSPSKKFIRHESPAVAVVEENNKPKPDNISEDNSKFITVKHPPKSKNRKADLSVDKNLVSINAELDSMLEGIKQMSASKAPS